MTTPHITKTSGPEMSAAAGERSSLTKMAQHVTDCQISQASRAVQLGGAVKT